MKILPANLDDFNDLEKIGDEFYFRKDENEKGTVFDTDSNKMNSDGNSLFMSGVTPTTVDHETIPYSNKLDPQLEETNIFYHNNNGLRDVRSTLGYDELQSRKKSLLYQPISATDKPLQHTTSNVWGNELLAPDTSIFETVSIDNDNLIQNENWTHGTTLGQNVKHEDFAIISTNRADIERKNVESEEDYDLSYEDYAVEIKGPKILRKNKIRVHTSYQKTAIRQPFLQQGFIFSPGYPKYYIGNLNCSWRITVPSEQRIKLIILDVNLRCKFVI